MLLAVAYTEQRNYRPALTQVDLALGKLREPRESWLQLKMGLHYELREWPRVAEVLVRLINLAPSKPDYWNQLSGVFFELRRQQEALAVLALAERQGLPSTRRALDALPTPASAVYVADTLGEMGLFFALTGAQDGIVFVGGSLTRRGGHNPLEPAHFGCAILHGPDMRNNLEMAEALAGAGAALTVATPDALAEAVETLFATPAERQRLAAAASQVAQAHAGVLDRAMTALAPFLARLPD